MYLTIPYTHQDTPLRSHSSVEKKWYCPTPILSLVYKHRSMIQYLEYLEHLTFSTPCAMQIPPIERKVDIPVVRYRIVLETPDFPTPDPVPTVLRMGNTTTASRPPQLFSVTSI